MAKEISSKLDKTLPWILIVGSIIGLICSFIVSMDKLELAQNPNFVPSCDLNPVIACGGVMKSAQAHLFDFPNPWIGFVGFAVLITVGVAILAGAKFKRWFWQWLQIGVTLGMVFAYWLLLESIYSIQALCPYCLGTDIVVTTMFWYVTLYNLKQGNLGSRLQKSKLTGFARRHHLDILILWFLIFIALILQHFWYYYGKFF